MDTIGVLIAYIADELHGIRLAMEKQEALVLVPGIGSTWRHAAGFVAVQDGISKREGEHGTLYKVSAIDDDGAHHEFSPGEPHWKLVASAPSGPGHIG